MNASGLNVSLVIRPFDKSITITRQYEYEDLTARRAQTTNAKFFK